MDNPTLSIVIPAYLEEENLRVLLPRIKKVISAMAVPTELLVVDAQTKMDNTQCVCQENGAVHIPRETGNYFGDAVTTGIKYAKGEYILFMDADGSHSPEFIPVLYAARADHDIVIASRYVDGGGSDNKKILIFMSEVVNHTFSFVLRLHCKDVSNSFKLYRADLLKSIHLVGKNFDIVEEILVKLKRKNGGKLAIQEIPYFFKERMFGHTKRNLVSFFFSYLFTLIKLRFLR